MRTNLPARRGRGHGFPFDTTDLDLYNTLIDSFSNWIMEDPVKDKSIVETETGYTVEIPMTGIPKEDISIELMDDRLTIKAESKKQWATGNFCSTVNRAFSVPPGTEVEDLKTTYENGVLSIDIAKKIQKGKEPKRIEIS